MKPKILLEGPDGSGKTTLAKRLAEYYDIPYLKFSQSKSVEEAVSITDTVSNHGPCVIDRVKALDHVIYGQLIDGIDFTPAEHAVLRASLERLVGAPNFKILYLYGDPDVLWYRITSRPEGDDYIKKEHLPVLMGFYRYYLGARHNCLHIDTSHMTPDEVFDKSIGWVGKK